MNSKERRQNKRSLLGSTADDIAEEIRVGKWNHIPDLQTRPIPQIKEIIKEMERRCPGHELEEYTDSIARSIFNNR